jgi:hypothetical protein
MLFRYLKLDSFDEHPVVSLDSLVDLSFDLSELDPGDIIGKAEIIHFLIKKSWTRLRKVSVQLGVPSGALLGFMVIVELDRLVLLNDIDEALGIERKPESDSAEGFSKWVWELHGSF